MYFRLYGIVGIWVLQVFACLYLYLITKPLKKGKEKGDKGDFLS